MSYEELGRAVREIAGGLIALGIAPKDRVAIIANTRAEWTLADLGALCASATVVPIYQTDSSEQCAYVLAHSEVRLVFCEDESQLNKIEQVKARCPQLEQTVVFESASSEQMSLADLRSRGRDVEPALIEERVRAVTP
jgi:long-chain acyl-CoA synthetase